MSEFCDTALLRAHNKLAFHANVLKGTQKSGERIPKDVCTWVKRKMCLCAKKPKNVLKGTQKSGERFPKDVCTWVNEKGVSVLKSSKNGIASALQKIRHTQLAVLELNGICDFVVYYFCLLSFKIPLLVRSHSWNTIHKWKDKYC